MNVFKKKKKVNNQLRCASIHLELDRSLAGIRDSKEFIRIIDTVEPELAAAQSAAGGSGMKERRRRRRSMNSRKVENEEEDDQEEDTETDGGAGSSKRRKGRARGDAAVTDSSPALSSYSNPNWIRLKGVKVTNGRLTERGTPNGKVFTVDTIDATLAAAETVDNCGVVTINTRTGNGYYRDLDKMSKSSVPIYHDGNPMAPGSTTHRNTDFYIRRDRVEGFMQRFIAASIGELRRRLKAALAGGGGHHSSGHHSSSGTGSSSC